MFRFRALPRLFYTTSTASHLRTAAQQNAQRCNVSPAIIERVERKLLTANMAHPLAMIKRRLYRLIQNAAVDLEGGEREGERKGESDVGGSFHIVEDLSPVVSTYQNFDSLGIPKDHVSRSRSDTYYVDDETVLRTHTSAHQVQLMREGFSSYLIAGDVYRRDTVDSSHYPVFHQMEGVKLWKKSDAGVSKEAAGEHLRSLLTSALVDSGLFRPSTATAQNSADAGPPESELNQAQISTTGAVYRWIPAYFPFTEPSWELEVWWRGEWLEVLGCGVIADHVLAEAGKLETHTGWAFGLGLDRLCMLLYDIPDIRLLWSNDRRFTSQWEKPNSVTWAQWDETPIPFQEFSRFPACYKDVSFWLPEGKSDEDGTFSENDIHELVRNAGGDLVETVQLLDAFTNPRTHRRSLCYRITYRDMHRSLTNEEVDDIQWGVRDALVRDLDVELR